MRASERIAIADGDADTAQIAAFERDRRELIRRGIAAGGAVVAASCIPLLLSVRHAFAAGETDPEIVRKAIRLENVAVLAYDTLIARGLLSGNAERLAKLLRDHERRHAAALTAALTAMRGALPPKPTGVGDVDAVVKGIGDLRSQSDAVGFAIELELAAVAAYRDAQRKLYEPRLLQTAATIMGSEGQHLVVLRRAAGTDPVPNALETGKQQ